MAPFFTFYGGKWRAAPRYPEPVYERIIEPFAGAAGYAVRHYERDIVLVEKDPVIAGLWRWLIAARPEDVLCLPLLANNQTVDDLNIAPAEKSLIGFWLNKGAAQPCKSPSAWMRSGIRPRSYWGEEIRARISGQVEAIKHWTVIEGDYSEAEACEATWFIDPPYQRAGTHYRMSSRLIDYSALADWCRSRAGQAIVCENEGADWLPFVPYHNIKSTPGKRGKSRSAEAIWQSPARASVSGDR